MSYNNADINFHDADIFLLVKCHIIMIEMSYSDADILLVKCHAVMHIYFLKGLLVKCHIIM